MRFNTHVANGSSYLVVTDGQLTAESDAVELVSACVEHDTNLLLLPQSAISADFRDLSTRLAGLVLGKLANYRIRTVAVIDSSDAKGAWADFLAEARNGPDFRVCATDAEAVNWLTRGQL
jgi:hypothetical protein